MEKKFAIAANLRNFMSQVGRQSLYHYYLWHFKGKEPPLKLFILSHMRSGSSLLTHILNTNPEVLGFGETFTQYSSEKDFYQLMAEVHFTLRQFRVSETYLLDKILHDRIHGHGLINNSDILKSDKTFVIFLIREPESSLASMIKLMQNLNQEKALDYYTGRLLSLENYAKLIDNKDRCFLLTYDQLCHQTESVLKRLQEFLNVQHAFSEQYQILRTTGRKYVGDSSSKIQAGKIMKKNKTPDIHLLPHVIEKATKAFNQCYASLSDYCLMIDSE